MSERRRGRIGLIAPNIGRIDSGQTQSVEKQVYHLLRRALMSGILMSGTSLSGRSIAKSLGTSPQPIRDALKRLEADGVIESRNKSAYFVVTPTRQQFLEIQQLRILIEGNAAGIAARNAATIDADRIEAIHELYTQTDQFEETCRLNFLFHSEIYKLARSRMLLNVIENLMLRFGPLMHLSRRYSFEKVARNHARLVDALRRRDPAAAQRALRRDLSQTLHVIAPQLDAVESDGIAEGTETLAVPV